MKWLSVIILGLIFSSNSMADHRHFHGYHGYDHDHHRYEYYNRGYYAAPRYYQEIPHGYIPPIIQHQQFYTPIPRYNYYPTPALNFSFGVNGIILGN
jgi:hypothetical protein